MVWHYTLGAKLPGILNAGVLRTATAGGLLPGERPALWCTRASTWEPTCTPKRSDPVHGFVSVPLSDVVATFGPLARIAVPPSLAPHSFKVWRSRSYVQRRAANALATSARAAGSDIAEWRVGFEDVPIDPRSVEVESSEDGVLWTPMLGATDGDGLGTVLDTAAWERCLAGAELLRAMGRTDGRAALTLTR